MIPNERKSILSDQKNKAGRIVPLFEYLALRGRLIASNDKE